MVSHEQGGNRWATAVLVPALMLVAALAVNAQQGTREITSGDFTGNRPSANTVSGGTTEAPAGGQTTQPRRPRIYRPLSKTANSNKPSKPPSPRPNQPNATNADVAQLGVTIWRLRLAQAADKGTRQLIRDDKSGASTAWIPERVASDTLLRAGDRIRISIESPHDGYIYVVDRDEFANGRTGAINLIFPLAGEDNHVYAGRLIDIPSPEGSMKANPTPDQSGEVLSIIVTNKPLDLPLTNDVLPITRAQLQEWEKVWGGATEIWELEGGSGETWTPQEKQAAARTGTRQLTRDDPPPQTIYRISPSDTKAMLVNVRLRYAK
jgi:uncharacterized protein DUF4384